MKLEIERERVAGHSLRLIQKKNYIWLKKVLQNVKKKLKISAFHSFELYFVYRKLVAVYFLANFCAFSNKNSFKVTLENRK